MAQQKISQLTQASSISGTELLPCVQSGTTKSCTANQIFNSNKSSTWTNSRIVQTNASGKLETTSLTASNISTGLQNAADALNGVSTINSKVADGRILSTTSIVVQDGTLCSSRQINSGSETALGTISCPFKGAAIIVVSASVGANTIGRRTLKCGNSTVTCAPSPSGVTRMQVTELYLSSGNSVEVTFEQNSGAALNVTASYELISLNKYVS